MKQAIYFTNYTDEDFTHTYDSVGHLVKAGESKMMPDYLARHLAKHLAVKELNKKDENTNSLNMKPLIAKCLGEAISAEDDAGLQVASMNFKPKKEKKEEPKEEPKKEEPKDKAPNEGKEFPSLKKNQ